MKKYKKLTFISTALITLGLVLSGCGNSDASSGEEVNYPTESIELVLPYSPGGQTDISARVVADHLKDIIGEDIVVVNQDGGGGAVALNTVLNSNKPGYQLFFGHQATYTGYATGQLDVNVTEDTTPITTFSSVGQAYIVSADSPWDSLEEFVEDAKESPGQYKYGVDFGGTTHFMGAMLTNETGIELDMVDVGGEAERISALLGKQVDIVVTSIGNAVKYVESGDYKVLATLTEERVETAPDFPTATEQGYDIVFEVTNILMGPKDLDDSIVQKINEAVEELVADEDYQNQLVQIDQPHVYLNHEETVEFVNEEFEYIQTLAAELGF